MRVWKFVQLRLFCYTSYYNTTEVMPCQIRANLRIYQLATVTSRSNPVALLHIKWATSRNENSYVLEVMFSCPHILRALYIRCKLHNSLLLWKGFVPLRNVLVGKYWFGGCCVTGCTESVLAVRSSGFGECRSATALVYKKIIINLAL